MSDLRKQKTVPIQNLKNINFSWPLGVSSVLPHIHVAKFVLKEGFFASL
jgi:hypothetical protein